MIELGIRQNGGSDLLVSDAADEMAVDHSQQESPVAHEFDLAFG